ncbi:MAG: response regulator [Proteobacteria bacterium]|nr:response regulator [Pseudomonadota bacterium]
MRAYVRGVLRENFDCSIFEVGSGFEALRLMPREQFDLVITDINMPDINGLELVRFIRNSEHHKKVPLMIISTQTSEQNRKRVFELGANSFMAKPFEPEKLVRAVGELIDDGKERISTDEL